MINSGQDLEKIPKLGKILNIFSALEREVFGGICVICRMSYFCLKIILINDEGDIKTAK